MAIATWVGIKPDAPTAIAAAVIATWATAIVQMLALKRRIAQKIDSGPQRYAMRTWLSTSMPILVVEGFYLFLTYIDLLVLEHFRPPTEVALYYAAGKTLALVAFVNFSVAAAAAHKFTAYHVSGDRERLKAFLADSIRWTFWPSLAATLLILVLGRPLLWMFGAGFVEGYYLMFILAVGLLARAATGPVERLLTMLGEPRLCALVYAVSFALNLVLCLILIPRLGVAGAAIATSTALVVESILLFLGTKHRLGLHVFIWRGRK
jgi:O-antigen/teichoic acid export membrane protein